MFRILFYALGGGFGHARRARNLWRALRQISGDIEGVVLCREEAGILFDGSITVESPVERTSWALALWFHDCCLRFEPDLIVVDTFPRGILGELGFKPSQRRVLVTRRVPMKYYGKPEVLRALYEYDQVFWCEPGCKGAFPGIEVDPVVDPEPLPAPTQRRGVMGIGSGIYREEERLKEAFCKAFGSRGEWLDSVSWRQNLAKEMGGHEMMVCAAGYNTFYEVARSGTAAIVVPQERLYDDQQGRVTEYIRTYSESGFRLLPTDFDESTLARLASELKGPFEPREWTGAHTIARILMGHEQL